MRPRIGKTLKLRARRYNAGAWTTPQETLAAEEPLEIRLVQAGQPRPLLVTMRTPGDDFELAAGLLLAEGIIHQRNDIATIRYCVDPGVEQRYNLVNVELRPGLEVPPAALERQFAATSACGVCGKASIESLQNQGCSMLPPGPRLDPTMLAALPEALREQQAVFAQTGGLHAAAIFSTSGELLALREDIGRHNAVDKLVGWALLHNKPLAESIMLVSGRVGFELVQKCVVAGVPALCAISAPSSLAVETARTFGLTLVGFLRGERFTVYSGSQRFADSQ